MRTKMIVLLTASILLISLAIPVSARYSTISFFTAACETSGGSAECSTSFELYETYQYKIELWLQRSNDGGRTFKDYVRVLSTTSTGNGIIEHSKTRTGLDNSYLYETKAVITVYGSDGSVLDKGTAYSY